MVIGQIPLLIFKIGQSGLNPVSSGKKTTLNLTMNLLSTDGQMIWQLTVTDFFFLFLFFLSFIPCVLISSYMTRLRGTAMHSLTMTSDAIDCRPVLSGSWTDRGQTNLFHSADFLSSHHVAQEPGTGSFGETVKVT